MDKIQCIPPDGDYIRFETDEEAIEKGIEWKLFTARSVKKELVYKSGRLAEPVKLKGYQVYGSGQSTAVVEFADGSLTCVHPAYLKEMQSAGFTKELLSGAVLTEITDSPAPPVKQVAALPGQPEKKEKKKPVRQKAPKLELPEEKVHFTARVKEFSAKMNHFTGEEDEVILLDKVRITGEKPIEIGDAWCSYSKTLKKAELEPGDVIEFDGKAVAKKFSKEVPYKVNNPSKLVKAEAE